MNTNLQGSKVLVVGAGISGLTAANMLARNGAKVEVWESSAEPGGLLAPVPLAGALLDKGSHRVHPSSFKSFFAETNGTEWQERSRRGFLVMDQRHIPYPPGPLGFARGLGMRASLSMLAGFLVQKGNLRRFKSWSTDRTIDMNASTNYETFVTARVGKTAYRRFYEPYAKKVWGLPPSELSCTVAKQRVSSSKPLRSLAKSFCNAASKQNVFLYPTKGMAGLLGNVIAQTASRKIAVKYNRTADLAKLAETNFQHIVYSGVPSVPGAQDEQPYKGLYLLHYVFPRGVVKQADTFYVPGQEYWFGRVSRPDLFSPATAHKDGTAVCVEIPEGAWGPDHRFLEDGDVIINQLAKAGILTSPTRPIHAKQTFLDKVYPVYRPDWQKRWHEKLSRLTAFDQRVIPIGRFGLFLHCNMDHCVAISSAATEHLLQGRSAENWIQKATQFQNLVVRD